MHEKAISWIFSGNVCCSIELNLKGIRTKRGSKISINSVTRMLHNRKYIGEYKYRDIYKSAASRLSFRTKTITFAELEKSGLGSDINALDA